MHALIYRITTHAQCTPRRSPRIAINHALFTVSAHQPAPPPPPPPFLVLPRATVVLQAPDSRRKRNNRLEDYSKPEATSTQQARSYAHPKYTQEHIRVSHLYKRWEKNQAQFRPLPIYHKNVSRVECDVCLAPILLPLRPHQRGWKSYHPRLPTPTPM